MMKKIFKDIRFYIALLFFLIIVFYIVMIFVGNNKNIQTSEAINALNYLRNLK